MNVQVLRRYAPSALLLLLGLVCGEIARAEKFAASDKHKEQPAPIELFAAIDAGQVSVSVVPRDSEQVTMQIKNKTKLPLSVKMPTAFVVAPVLAQFNGAMQFAPQGRGAGNAANQAPQTLGTGVQNGANNQRGGNGIVGGQNFFNIPPGKTLRLRLASVCLEFGKDEPHAHYPYEARSLESFTKTAGVSQVIEQLAAGAYTQREAQIAAWHLANGLSWEKLANLTIDHANGQQERRFHPQEMARAQQLVREVAKQADQGKASAGSSATK